MITILSGTNRPGANTRKIVALLEADLQSAGETVRVLDLADLPKEIFAPASYADKPEAFAPFAEAVLTSAGVIVVTPEYNGGPPGVLKYFIDMLPFPESFERRPVAFVGVAAGRWGALRPVEQLQAIFAYRNACLFPERVFLPSIDTQLDDHGQLKDPALATRLRALAIGFAEFVRRLTVVA